MGTHRLGERSAAAAPRRRGRGNLRRQFLLLFVLVQTLLVLFICLSNLDSIRYVNEQTAQANTDILKMYAAQLDQRLYETKNYLLMLHTNESNMVVIQSPLPDVRQLAYVGLTRKIQRDISLYPSVNLIFLHNQLDQYDLWVYGSDSQYQDRLAQRSYLLDALAVGRLTLNRWTAVELEGSTYLLHVVEQSGINVAAWMRCDTLLAPLQASLCTLTDETGTVLTNQALFGTQLLPEQRRLTANGQNYQLVSYAPAQAEVRVWLAVPAQGWLGQMSAMQWITLIGSLLSIAGVPLLLWMIYRQIIKPLAILQGAMKRIGAGELDAPITEEGVPEEFRAVNHAFNEMTREMKQLKIKSYEDVIEKQRLRLGYYQMQIKPHFFINALTTISNLERLGRKEEMQQFIYHLSLHVRYMMQPAFAFVSVKEELEQITNFLLMQNIRCTEQFSCVKDCSEQAAQVRIPPFTIYNFAENVVRHATRKSAAVVLFIEVGLVEDAGKARLHIVIEDNGDGLADADLARINDFDPPVHGHHIGLWNTRQTLSLVYHEDYELTLCRSELGGLKAELLLPTQADEGMGKDKADESAPV